MWRQCHCLRKYAARSLRRPQCEHSFTDYTGQYSTTIFTDAGSTYKNALLFSLGAGLINFLGAIPGTLTIDRTGRRSLLLWTFPMMALCLFFTGAGFYVKDEKVRTGIVGSGIYLFMCIYSPGMGPVPFTYAAESYVSWSFSFVLVFLSNTYM